VVKSWLRRIRGAVGMGLTWAVAWVMGGVVIGVASLLLPNLFPWEVLFEAMDPLVPLMALPGFIGGAVFSVVLGIAGRRHRFDKLSLPRFAAWGTVGGLLVSAPVTMALGFSPASVAVASLMALLCAGSATGSLALARMGEERELLDASADVAEVGLTRDEAQELLGGRG
jgi:hypothetical protein